jgi:hypothetical protein
MSKSPKVAAPAQVATFTPVARVTPADRRRKSEVANPVGVTWAICLNATGAGSPPARKDLHAAAYAAGVAYATVRTQVQRFLAWHKAGADRAKLPRGITISE